MTKQEFIDRLKSAINGRIPAAQVMDTINYYEDYINTEIRKGKSESEVMDLLGDPRLIAKTIIQTSAGQDNMTKSEEYRGNYQDANYQNTEYRGTPQGGSYKEHTNKADVGGFLAKLPGWLVAIIVMVLLVLVLSAVFSLLSFLAPLIIVMAGVIFLVKLFRDWLN